MDQLPLSPRAALENVRTTSGLTDSPGTQSRPLDNPHHCPLAAADVIVFLDEAGPLRRYSMVLSGEIDVEFDSGQVVTMKQGDIIIMRGVTHNWKNKSTVPAVTAFILIDATPFEAGGEKKGTL